MSTYLMHHGIKGMKWGVRRTPEELGYTPNERSKNPRGSYYQRLVGKRTDKAMTRLEKTNNARSRERLKRKIEDYKHDQKAYSSLSRNDQKHRDKVAKFRNVAGTGAKAITGGIMAWNSMQAAVTGITITAVLGGGPVGVTTALGSAVATNILPGLVYGLGSIVKKQATNTRD